LTDLSNQSLKVNFLVDGKSAKTLWIRFDAVARGIVVVSSRPIPYNHLITRDDLAVEQRELTRLGDFLEDPESVVGSLTKVSLQAGTPVALSSLRKPELVRRGDSVTLLVQGPTFLVSTAGRAKGSGSKGEQVTVENLTSKQIVHGTVVAEKTVRVSFLRGNQ
jgi:flagella basal body P-ring formation protein FlgA